MKKLMGFIGVTAAVLCFTACGMKECKCISSNRITQNDSLISFMTDTVSNQTRGNCEDFNVDETMEMDTNIVIHHILLCEEN